MLRKMTNVCTASGTFASNRLGVVWHRVEKYAGVVIGFTVGVQFDYRRCSSRRGYAIALMADHAFVVMDSYEGICTRRSWNT